MTIHAFRVDAFTEPVEMTVEYLDAAGKVRNVVVRAEREGDGKMTIRVNEKIVYRTDTSRAVDNGERDENGDTSEAIG